MKASFGDLGWGTVASSLAGEYAAGMSTLQEIQEAIRRLSRGDLALLRAWFVEYDAEAWDRQIEQDAAAGLLDRFAEEALRTIRKR
jgi:hypothetical protein